VAPRPFRPKHTISLLRYIFPNIHKQARTGFDTLRYDTLPAYRTRTQSRLWRFILDRRNKRQVKREAGRGVLVALQKQRSRLLGDVGSKMSQEDNLLGRGSRRKKLAGYLKAANELRQSYTQAYLSSNDRSQFDEESDIPGAFPNLKVSRSGGEELVLFPSYARRHSKRLNSAPDYPINSNLHDANGSGDAEYWRREWEIYEDANAVVDVDVRGWIYTPHKGPMNRKNRILLGIARHLSGIPAPPSGQSEVTRHEDKMAERQAAAIARQGEEEADIAGRGGFSELTPENLSAASSRSVSPKPGQLPHPVTNTSLNDDNLDPGNLKKQSSFGSIEMTQEELVAANAQLMRRLKPFFTNPAVGMSLTVFYYNDSTSQSRTTTTNESGHFNFRAALNFIPTHVRVLASEDLSATSEVIITEPTGISLISDIDDTIKHSAIGAGAKEIFRNAFVRELGDLVIKGVKEWYNKMFDMGVKIHYVSNSPWQMYPLLVNYFSLANLPPGSFHLKQYSGMLQGIFEPVAERKKATLDRIMNDFPERYFILVGDSGEADLELYVETALRVPDRILAIFIRDVTTSPAQRFFDQSNQILQNRKASPHSNEDYMHKPKIQSGISDQSPRPKLPPRPVSDYPAIENEMEDLISFSDDEISEPKPTIERVNTTQSTRSPRPPPPSKPLALRSNSGDSQNLTSPGKTKKPPPPPTRKSSTVVTSNTAANNYRNTVTQKVSTAYNALPSATTLLEGSSNNRDRENKNKASKNSSPIAEWAEKSAPPLPPRRGITSYPAAAANYASNRISGAWYGESSNNRNVGSAPPNKREELWRRRLQRAREVLEGKNIVLKTWRVGSDVEKEAVALVERYTKK
jgi:phosphatidate phosphatase APP1